MARPLNLTRKKCPVISIVTAEATLKLHGNTYEFQFMNSDDFHGTRYLRQRCRRRKVVNFLNIPVPGLDTATFKSALDTADRIGRCDHCLYTARLPDRVGRLKLIGRLRKIGRCDHGLSLFPSTSGFAV